MGVFHIVASRFRNFATVVYPESAPADWMGILSEFKVPVVVSPLHDQDVNPDGEIKKAHHHVLFCFEGVKTPEQVKVFIDQIAGVGCEVVSSLRGYARYLCHMDNPEKYQYDSAGVRAFGGIDYFSLIGLPTDKYKSVGEMIDWCEETDCISYAQLLKYARAERYDWFRVLCDSSTLVIKEYLKSRKWSIDQGVYSDDK